MNDEKDGREEQIAARARGLFADSVAGLDGQTRSRLARARAAAVDAAGRKRSWWTPSQLVPVGGVAVAALVIALFWSVPDAPDAPVAPVGSAALNDLDLLLEGEELDLFEELEFYAWLLEQPELLEQAAGQDDSG